MRFEHQVALVTGAASGIGRALVQLTRRCDRPAEQQRATSPERKHERKDVKNERNRMMNIHNQTAPEQVIDGLFGGKNLELVGNPFALLAQMRSMGAVVPIPFPQAGADHRAWALTRMQEVVQVLKDHARFTVEGNNRHTAEPGEMPTFFTSKSMVSVDEPDHRRLCLLVSKAFTPRYIESLRPRVQQIADDLLDRVADRGQMDLVADYAFLLPINVIAEMLGIPPSDWAQIRTWSEAIANGVGLGRRDPGVPAHVRAFGEYTARLVADKRAHPGEDLTSQLIATREQGDRLNETELLSMIILLIFRARTVLSKVKNC